MIFSPDTNPVLLIVAVTLMAPVLKKRNPKYLVSSLLTNTCKNRGLKSDKTEEGIMNL